MKQLEEIQKAEKQLIKIKQELLKAQKKLDKNITKQIEQKERERRNVNSEIVEIKKAFVSPITDAPKQYINGYSHLMKKAERKKVFQKKIEEEYLPLMKKSLNKYLEGR